MWTKTSFGNTVAEIVMAKSGMSEDELKNPEHLHASGIAGIDAAVALVRETIKKKQPIHIFGDYDTDGITSTCILMETLQSLKANVTFRMPKRMSEGYGITVDAVNEIESGLLITVDNGIAAIDAIKAARAKGLDVLVLDHHLAGEELPEANVIVDPHIKPEDNAYEFYCGAGLALKFEEAIIAAVGKSKSIANQYWRHVALAAIGTVADVMPLTGDNRWIVKTGLQILRHKRRLLPFTLQTIMKESELSEAMTETDIAFKIAPIFNAAGRMYDNGAKAVVSALLLDNQAAAELAAKKLLKINDERKQDQKSGVEKAEQIIADECLFCVKPLILYVPKINEGIIGIITGKLAEKYKVPTFVFTDSTEEGILKGSGRSYGDYNLKTLIDLVVPVTLKAGGHAGAAGITVRMEDFGKMSEIMYAEMDGYEAADIEEMFYDMEIKDTDVKDIYAQLQEFAPYGEGNPMPVFKIANATLSPRAGKYYKTMGSENEHLKLLGNGFSGVAFGMAEQYLSEGAPKTVNLFGTLSINWYFSKAEYQVDVIEYEPVVTANKASALLSAMRTNPL